MWWLIDWDLFARLWMPPVIRLPRWLAVVDWLLWQVRVLHAAWLVRRSEVLTAARGHGQTLFLEWLLNRVLRPSVGSIRVVNFNLMERELFVFSEGDVGRWGGLGVYIFGNVDGLVVDDVREVYVFSEGDVLDTLDFEVIVPVGAGVSALMVLGVIRRLLVYSRFYRIVIGSEILIIRG